MAIVVEPIVAIPIVVNRGDRALLYTQTSPARREWIEVVVVSVEGGCIWVMTKGGFWVNDEERLMKIQIDSYPMECIEWV